MIEKGVKTVLTRLILAILICTLGAAMLVTHASGFEDNAVSSGVAYYPAAAAQDCYTLDTSRPEWLAAGPSTAIYLPVVVKNW